MRTAAIVLLWLAALPATLFLAVYGWPWRWRDTLYAWHMAAFTAVILALVGLLIAATYRLAIPPLLGVAVLAALDGVMWWRFALLVISQRKER